jgi:hypothetical protein
MDAYTHTIIAVASMLVAYFAGMYWSRKDLVEQVVDAFLVKLENEGFIRTAIDNNGDKELVPVSTVVAEALKEKLYE